MGQNPIKQFLEVSIERESEFPGWRGLGQFAGDVEQMLPNRVAIGHNHWVFGKRPVELPSCF